jgi:hypothetical protein
LSLALKKLRQSIVLFSASGVGLELGEALFFRWHERKQRDRRGKKGNSTFSFFNFKFTIDNINKKIENQTWYKANAG